MSRLTLSVSPHIHSGRSTAAVMGDVLIALAPAMIMSVVWIILESPDLAITEAAVGAGVTSLLFFLALKKIHAIDARNEVRKKHAQEQRGGDE